jgi:hypothetical protein
MVTGVVAAAAVAAGGAAWTFDTGRDGWSPNSHITNVVVRDGRMQGTTVDWDPMFIRRDLEIRATPWQIVVLRMKSNRAGSGQLYWTGETTGRYGGFDPDKATSFEVAAGEDVRDIAIVPFWQGERVIRQLRLDLFDGAVFEIDSIRVVDWGGGTPPQTDTYEWAFGSDPAAWRPHPSVTDLYAPPLDLDVRERGWVAVAIDTPAPGTASLLWSPVGGRGGEEFSFALRPGLHTYNLELVGAPGWTRLAALGLRLPAGVPARPVSVRIGPAPSGPAEFTVDYLGLEDALPRPGAPVRILALVRNLGGGISTAATARLVLPEGISFAGGHAGAPLPPLEFNEQAELRWSVVPSSAGEFELGLDVPGMPGASGRVSVGPAPATAAAADGVPTPRPVATDVEICAYYFPGWNTDAKWDCIRRVAPVRKPVLGYYDEGNPECVDWQIKWAVENGISTFLVDWYWQAGSRHYEHWFDAYRRARHRDLLKVAIMWANHNAPDTHSAEDWRTVTRHWIERYFPLPAYQKLDGKPAVYIWDPRNIRRDVGGSDAVRVLLAESQAMAKAAGHAGITFVAMNGDFSASEMRRLADEGYVATTTYHEWGARAQGVRHSPYAHSVEDAPAAWSRKREAAVPLTYLPVVDTGWDSRPWHGDKSRVIDGRTPELFRRLLESARDFARTNGVKTLVLGPLNEWGEGSYIEPNVEYGFAMFEAVRSVFGTGDPGGWPVNFGPRDAGLGPYEYPQLPPATAWTFDGPARDWSTMMGIVDLEVSGGALRFRTTTRDPALQIQTRGIRARDFPRADLTMRVENAGAPTVRGQLFWSADAAAVTEHTSRSFEIPADGAPHTVTIDLAANPRWRGRITTLRLDPCAVPGARVAIEEFALRP